MWQQRCCDTCQAAPGLFFISFSGVTTKTRQAHEEFQRITLGEAADKYAEQAAKVRADNRTGAAPAA